MDFAKNEHLNKNIRRIFLFKINITFGAGAAAAGASSVILSDFFFEILGKCCDSKRALLFVRQPVTDWAPASLYILKWRTEQRLTDDKCCFIFTLDILYLFVNFDANFCNEFINISVFFMFLNDSRHFKIISRQKILLFISTLLLKFTGI